MITKKYIALTIWTFVGKVTSLLLNILSRFLIDFLTTSQGSFHFMVAVNVHSDFGAQVKKITASTFSLSVCHEVMGLDAMIFVF